MAWFSDRRLRVSLSPGLSVFSNARELAGSILLHPQSQAWSVCGALSPRRAVRAGEARFFGARARGLLEGGCVACFAVVVSRRSPAPPTLRGMTMSGRPCGSPLAIVCIDEAFEQVPESDHGGKRRGPQTMQHHRQIPVNSERHLAMIWERSNLVMNSVGGND